MDVKATITTINRSIKEPRMKEVYVKEKERKEEAKRFYLFCMVLPVLEQKKHIYKNIAFSLNHVIKCNQQQHGHLSLCHCQAQASKSAGACEPDSARYEILSMISFLLVKNPCFPYVFSLFLAVVTLTDHPLNLQLFSPAFLPFPPFPLSLSYLPPLTSPLLFNNFLHPNVHPTPPRKDRSERSMDKCPIGPLETLTRTHRHTHTALPLLFLFTFSLQ